jgi:hypothetical protein
MIENTKIPETVLYVAQVAGVKRIRMLVVESWEYESLECISESSFENFTVQRFDQSTSNSHRPYVWVYTILASTSFSSLQQGYYPDSPHSSSRCFA